MLFRTRARFVVLCVLQFGSEPDRFENTQVALREIQRFTMLFRTKAQLLWRVFLSQATLFPKQVEAVYRLRGRTEVGLGSGQGLARRSEVRLCGAERLRVLGYFRCATVQRLCDTLGSGNH